MLNLDQWKKIEEAVIRAEKSTSAEIYPVQMPSSSEYFWVGHRLGAIGLVLGTLFTWLYSYMIHWGEGPWIWLVTGQIIGWTLGWTLGQWNPLVRLLAGTSRMAAEVDETAHAIFLSHGVHRTANRNGVLVYVSWLEHLVEVLADENAYGRFPKEFWEETARRMGEALRSENPTDALAEEIERLGHTLAKDFPFLAEDKNELPNS